LTKWQLDTNLFDIGTIQLNRGIDFRNPTKVFILKDSIHEPLHSILVNEHGRGLDEFPVFSGAFQSFHVLWQNGRDGIIDQHMFLRIQSLKHIVPLIAENAQARKKLSMRNPQKNDSGQCD
jgi:hypothetical protein